jgi:hypothetical protein
MLKIATVSVFMIAAAVTSAFAGQGCNRSTLTSADVGKLRCVTLDVVRTASGR